MSLCRVITTAVGDETVKTSEALLVTPGFLAVYLSGIVSYVRRVTVVFQRRQFIASSRESQPDASIPRQDAYKNTPYFPARERFSVPFSPVYVSGDPQPRSREYGGAVQCLTSTS